MQSIMDTQSVSMSWQPMKKSKDLRLRIEPDLYDEFAIVAQDLGMPVSQIIRRLMTQFVDQNSSERQNTLFPLPTVSASRNVQNTVRSRSE